MSRHGVRRTDPARHLNFSASVRSITGRGSALPYSWRRRSDTAGTIDMTSPSAARTGSPADQADVLALRGPATEELLRRAQAARAANMTALAKHMAVGIGAGLDRLRDRVLGAVSDRALSGQR